MQGLPIYTTSSINAQGRPSTTSCVDVQGVSISTVHQQYSMGVQGVSLSNFRSVEVQGDDEHEFIQESTEQE